jgi:hypothetical protein
VYWEHIREIIELEKPEGIIVQLGGQTVKLAEEFHKNGSRSSGTSFPIWILQKTGAVFGLVERVGYSISAVWSCA